MTGGVFVIQKGGDLVEMTETPFEKEEDFQRLLAKYPNLLAGDQMNTDSPRRWLLVGREIAIPDSEGGSGRWSVDHLFLDQEGIPTLVEIKRSSDTRLRREVVGQLLDYAANSTVYWPADRIRIHFETQCEHRGERPEDLIAELVKNERDLDAFWQEVKTNLQAGRIRLVFLADLIPPELRRIVEFLNSQMDPAEVLAVELRHYTGGGISTLVPRVMGLTERSRIKTSRSEPRSCPWTPDEFLEKLQTSESQHVDQAESLINWAKEAGLRIVGGRGEKTAALNYELAGRHLFCLDDISNIARFRVNFYLLPAPFDQDEMRTELLQRLNAIGQIDLPEDTQYQGFKLSDLEGGEGLRELLDTLTWVVAVVRQEAETIP